jgi:hypothetical protein
MLRHEVFGLELWLRSLQLVLRGIEPDKPFTLSREEVEKLNKPLPSGLLVKPTDSLTLKDPLKNKEFSCKLVKTAVIEP